MFVGSSRSLAARATVRRITLCLAVVAIGTLQAQVAAARPEYPGEIKETLQLDCAPTCLLCHNTMEGGAENLNTYGTQNAAGVLNGIPELYAPGGPASMRNTDMDKEGISDRDEIIANTDPGRIEDVGICSDAVYGCGAAQMAPGSTPRTPLWALVSALGVAALLLRQVRA